MRLVVSSLLVLLACSGCNLIRGGPPRDHECRARLRTIIGLENAYYSETKKYSVHPVEIGFAPPQGNRYLYLLSKEGPLTRRDEVPSPPLAESVGYGPDTKKHDVLLEDLLVKLPKDLRDQVGLEGTCPDCELTIACVGNIDDDPAVDVWTISTKDRPGAARGTPIHHLNDLDPNFVYDAGQPPECTLATKLEPGVPGSPGHLIPSELNPNGASELATLMRTFVSDWKDARTKLEADAGVAFAPRWPVHRKMRCAWPTAADDRNPTFDGLAVNYLGKVKAFDEKPSRETYEGVLDGCKACHEVSCGGPLELIEGMRWK